MQFDSQTLLSLHEFLSSRLVPIFDADPEVLAEYILALLKHDKPVEELRSMCLVKLEDFLQRNTRPFVESLFGHLGKETKVESRDQDGEYDEEQRGYIDQNYRSRRRSVRKIPQTWSRRPRTEPRVAGLFPNFEFEDASGGGGGRILFVDRIPREFFVRESIETFFSQFGTIEETVLSGVSGESALVRFSGAGEAQKAYESPRAVFGNRFVRLSICRGQKRSCVTSAVTILAQRSALLQRQIETQKQLLVKMGGGVSQILSGDIATVSSIPENRIQNSRRTAMSIDYRPRTLRVTVPDDFDVSQIRSLISGIGAEEISEAEEGKGMLLTFSKRFEAERAIDIIPKIAGIPQGISIAFEEKK